MKILYSGSGFKLLALLSISVFIGSLSAAQDDDDLILLIPAIVAGATKEPEPIGIQKVKELTGQWLFSWDSGSPGIPFEDYYKFDGATAAQSPSDPTIFNSRR